MNIEGYSIIALNFLLIGLLPILFFKRNGSLNLSWWLTAAPFLISIGCVTATQFGFLPANIACFVSDPPPYMHVISVALCVASISLIMFTLGTHRIPIALWHQTNDAPQQIVTWGAYARIRHPFYTSFLLAFAAAAFYSPQFITLFALMWGAAALNFTAIREEKRLTQSDFGKDYSTYISQTGRFLPRI